ncbi:MAG: tRNA (adenosine(37)-N6)-threonylcarbamoyltransferase complex dimerization subunit type 1 TsaB [Mucinivorans sp.]
MARIITIETSGGVSSIALSVDGQCLAVHSAEGHEQTHSLTIYIEQLLSDSELTIEQIDAIAVSAGPGSYTGLRIGVSVAKGICFAGGKKLIAIPTLQALTFGAMKLYASKLKPQTILIPMIDARRMEIYTATYNSVAEEISPVEAMIVDENSFASLRGKEVITFGSGAAKCNSILGFNVVEVPLSAQWLCSAAEQKFNNSDFEDVAYFEPAYLKEFVALTSQKKYF